MGGWNNGCNPYFYMYYSIYQYGPSPNYWKINKYGGESPSGCTEENMYCYVCEPKWAPSPMKDFAIWPTPEHSATWKAAVSYY